MELIKKFENFIIFIFLENLENLQFEKI